MVDVDGFSSEGFFAIETEAVLIAVEDWVGAGDVNAGVSTGAIEHVLVRSQHIHRQGHCEGRFQQIPPTCCFCSQRASLEGCEQGIGQDQAR